VFFVLGGKQMELSKIDFLVANLVRSRNRPAWKYPVFDLYQRESRPWLIQEHIFFVADSETSSAKKAQETALVPEMNGCERPVPAEATPYTDQHSSELLACGYCIPRD
jgi:hypothetical protein